MTPERRKAQIRQIIGNKPSDYDASALRFIAEGPLVDPGRIYCPCGRLTLAEAKAREAAQVERLS